MSFLMFSWYYNSGNGGYLQLSCITVGWMFLGYHVFYLLLYIFCVWLGPLPKPLGKEKKVQVKSLNSGSLMRFVWRTWRVYRCSSLGCVNRIEFYLRAAALNTPISPGSSAPPVVFPWQQRSLLCSPSSRRSFPGRALPSSSRWQRCRAGRGGRPKPRAANGSCCETHPCPAWDWPLAQNNVPKSAPCACLILLWCLLSYSTAKYVDHFCRRCCAPQSRVVV